jgi:hypothetical protein
MPTGIIHSVNGRKLIMGVGGRPIRGDRSVVVDSTVATQIVITTSPAGVTSGSPFTTQPIVRLRDVSNANVAESGVVVTAYLSSGSGALSGVRQVATDASGIATFTNLTYTGPGFFTVSFSALLSEEHAIWLDTAETDLTANYFEVETNGGLFSRVSDGGSTRWRAVCGVGNAAVDLGNLKLGFGRMPSGGGLSSSGFTTHDFGKVSVECDMYHSVNSLTADQDKFLRMIVIASGNWAEAAKSHCWSNGTTHLQLDPTTTVVDNVMNGTGSNDYAHQRYLGAVDGSKIVFAGAGANAATTLRHYVHEMTLNAPGIADGSNRLYIDGVLDIERTGLDFVGRWTGYGINSCRWENYRELGIGKANNRYMDNLKVTGWARVLVHSSQLDAGAAAVQVGGTGAIGWTETEAVAGGDTLVLTLSDDTFLAAGASFDGQRQAVIDGLVAATSPANGWNALRSTISVTALVRTSSTVVTLTVPALATYSITNNEILTWTVPAAALTGGVALVATPTITITATGGVTPWLEEDFSSYANNAAVQASAWYTGAPGWQDTAWSSTNGMSLDLTEGYGTSDRCLKTSFPAGAYDRRAHGQHGLARVHGRVLDGNLGQVLDHL